jgi:hypothetical protein
MVARVAAARNGAQCCTKTVVETEERRLKGPQGLERGVLFLPAQHTSAQAGQTATGSVKANAIEECQLEKLTKGCTFHRSRMPELASMLGEEVR